MHCRTPVVYSAHHTTHTFQHTRTTPLTSHGPTAPQCYQRKIFEIPGSTSKFPKIGSYISRLPEPDPKAYPKVSNNVDIIITALVWRQCSSMSELSLRSQVRDQSISSYCYWVPDFIRASTLPEQGRVHDVGALRMITVPEP